MFECRSNIPGQLQQRISRSSTTIEFLRSNFGGRDPRDTVYITANPQFYRHCETIDTKVHEALSS